MKRRNILLTGLLALSFTNVIANERYVGADISLLPTYEEANARYKDTNGEPISDLLTYLYDEGMRAMRVRLFVNPESFDNNDPNASQDLDFIIPLCQRIVNDGYDLMLDFHYSDTWADPVAQWIPDAWKGQTDEELYKTVYDYTKETLSILKENGIVPAFIQPGNEISYGMLWSPYGAPESEQKKTLYGSSANWNRLGEILNNAISACREECPNAKIIIHTERVAQVNVQHNFYQKMEEMGIDYDIIGLSYYPYFHGDINVLNKALGLLETNFPSKEIMIVETGYPYAWEVPGTTQKVDYPYTEAGQKQFAEDLVNTLLSHESVTGLFWWWLEYNAYGTDMTGWYNAPLFDSRTGKATAALNTICSFGSAYGGIGTMVDRINENKTVTGWFDINGRKLIEPSMPGIYVKDGRQIIIK